MNLNNRLSKSRFVKGLRCPLALYLSVHHRELASDPTPDQEARFETGHRVGALAQQRIPAGVLVTEDHLHHAEAVETTKRLLADKVPAIYEAAFVHDNVKVRVDLLVLLADDNYELVEVKSTTKYDKAKHLADGGIQLYVLLGAGIPVTRVSLMHLNREYLYPGGDYDVQELFTATDITADAFDYITAVPERIAEMMEVLALAEPPDPPLTVDCTKPYACEFFAWCTRDAAELDLSAPVRTDPAVLKRLDHLVFPLHFVDFETIMPALPVFPGTRPYQTSKVQWSVHTLHADGHLEHAEYLLSDKSRAPDAEFMSKLLECLGAEGTFIHYSPYERTQLVDIALRYPEWRQPLVDCIPGFYDALARKLADAGESYSELRAPTAVPGGLLDFDLGLRVVKDGCFHPVFGSDRGYSIKPAIKVLAPNLPPYDGLAIGDGNAAMMSTERMLADDTPASEVAQIRADLLAYCKQDTMAMIEIYRTLTSLMRGEVA